MVTNSTIKNETIVVLNNPVQEEIKRAIEMANERNTKQIAAEYHDENHVLVWGVKVKGVTGKANRYEAKLSRALMVAPITEGNKGYSMRGAFKAIPFQFDVKTGEIFPLSGETKERRDLLAKWAKPLIAKFMSGLHMIHNGQFRTTRGYNGLRNEKFTAWVKRYNGITNTETSFDDSALASDVESAVLD
jgi:hypothetical protein